jgi:hypothetical protein
MDTSASSEFSAKNRHAWRFFRAGGVIQVQLASGKDIAAIPELDLKLWFALAMPVNGVDIDPSTMRLVDADGDGRIRPPEIIQAVKWAEAAFVSLDDLLAGGDSVKLAAIKSGSIRRSAKNMLAALGRSDADCVTLADVVRMEEVFANTRFNGDGVVTPESAEDESLSKAVADMIAAVGSVQDRSGRAGLDAAKLDAFFKEGAAYLAWASTPDSEASLLPYGPDSFAAAASVAAVRAKVDDFFARVKLAAFDSRCAEAMNRSLAEYAAMSGRDLSATSSETSAFPLAYVGGGAALPLLEGVNPAWAGAVRALRDGAVKLVLGRSADFLTCEEWEKVKDAFAAFFTWQAAKPVTGAEKQGVERVRELLVGGYHERITALIESDVAAKPEFDEMHSVEKLVRFQRDLVRILTNFVNFSEFYHKRTAAFISGSLYLDSRKCRLCVDVTDAAAHAKLAGLAGMYLAYCDVMRPNGMKKTVVAAFTDGDSDNLMVGRNGVFFDNQGNDWDATITRVITSPISLREAFWSPYKRLQRFMDEFVAKRAAGSDAAAQAKLEEETLRAASAEKKDGVAAPAAVTLPKKIDVGTVAALGVAAGAIGATLSALATGLMSLSWWQFPLVFAGIILLISLPSMIMAWLKLKRRNLAPVLDANGWAINSRARINAPFGAAMTDTASLPVHMVGRFADPFAEKKKPWRLYLAPAVVLIAVVWVLDRRGKLYEWTDGVIGNAPRLREVHPMEFPAGSADVPNPEGVEVAPPPSEE